MTKQHINQASTSSHARKGSKAHKQSNGGLGGQASSQSPANILKQRKAQIVGVFAKLDAEREAAHIDEIGEKLFEAIKSKDLPGFQQHYLHMKNALKVDVEEYRRALPHPYEPGQTFMASVASAAIYHGALTLVEQQFRFGFSGPGTLNRTASGSPLTILAGLALLIRDHPEDAEIPSYLDVCDRCIAFCYEEALNCRPQDLDPQTGIMSILKLCTAYAAIEPLVVKHQDHYYAQFQAGLAPHPLKQGLNLLMPTDQASPQP